MKNYLTDEQEATRYRSPRSDSAHSWSPRKMGRVLAAVVTSATLALGGGTLAASAASAAAPAPAETVVSLTFDDGRASQMDAQAVLNQYDFDGTFYINSGFVDGANFVTRADLETLAAAGHEIGGHTVNHPDLAATSEAEVKRQVCNDRAVLTGWGYDVRSFAYPFASSTPANEAVVADCGYRSARMLGDIETRFGCAGCDTAESTPPENAFYTKALDQVEPTWTLDDYKAGVTAAENNGGGWVQYTFHSFCAAGAAGCEEPSTTLALFADFAEWLSTRDGVVVKTVGDVIGGDAKPVVTAEAVAAPGPGVNAITNAAFETINANGLPECWMQGGYGANTAAFTTSPGRSGNGSTVTVSGYTDGDAKLLPMFDSGTCSPTVTAGHTYSLRAYYSSTTVTQFAVYLRTAGGTWQYWTSSPWFAESDAFTQAAWTTPTIPAGMTGISFGLNMFNNGTITTDDYALYDSVGAPATDGNIVIGPVSAPVVTGPVEIHAVSSDPNQPTP